MYENVFKYYDKSKDGIILSADKDTVIALNAPFYKDAESEDFTFHTKKIAAGTKIKSSGRYFVDNDGIYWYQFITADGKWCFLAVGWLKNFSEANTGYHQTQKLFNEYLSMDAYVLENILCAAKIITTARENGILVSNSFDKRLYVLTQRLHNRQNNVAASGYVSDINVNVSSKYPYRTDLLKIHTEARVNAIPLIAIGVVIVAGLIIYTTWTATKQILENKWAKEARQDVILSDDLLKDMEQQLHPETWKQFKTKYGDILNRLDQLQKQSKQNSVLGIIKTGVIGLLAFIALDKFVINKK